MESKNIKILIIKSDKIGDFINFSPCLKILKDNIKKSHITLICSEYSYPIVKNYEYIDKLIVFRNKFMIINLLRNFKNLLTVKYNYLFQFDGKNSSYLIAYFVRAKLKSAICYIKKKKIFGIKYFKYRPNKFLLKSFKNHAFCPEDYSEFSHYQSNYIKLLENLNFNISAKKNLFSLDKSFESTFKKFYDNEISSNYILFHFDERWDKYSNLDRDNVKKIIEIISLKKSIIITLGVKNFSFSNELNKIYTNYSFINNKIILSEKKKKDKVFLLNNIPINLLAYFIKNSEKNVSSHSGTIVHMSPAFNKEFVDIIKRSKNKEYDRWIPLISNYKRINFDEINEKYLENFEI